MRGEFFLSPERLTLKPPGESDQPSSFSHAFFPFPFFSFQNAFFPFPFSRFKMLSSHSRHLSFKMRTGGKNIAAHLKQVGVKAPIYWENKESGRKYFRPVEEHISLMCQPPYVCPNRKEGDWQKDDPEMCSTCQHGNVFLILAQKFHILGLISFYQ